MEQNSTILVKQKLHLLSTLFLTVTVQGGYKWARTEWTFSTFYSCYFPDLWLLSEWLLFLSAFHNPWWFFFLNSSLFDTRICLAFSLASFVQEFHRSAACSKLHLPLLWTWLLGSLFGSHLFLLWKRQRVLGLNTSSLYITHNLCIEPLPGHYFSRLTVL